MPNFLINVTTRGAKKATSGMKKLSGSLMKLSKVAMIGAAGGALALGVAMKKATSAAAEQELQEKKLTQALGKNADALIKQAGALQQSSRFGDEAIIQQQAYLAAIGMSEQQIKEMIPVTLDLAAATGMSLESAVKNTAKTLSGMTGELGESVGSLRDLSAEELRAGEGINMMRELFKGAAAGEVKTFRGAMDQASNAVGDMMEALGDLALPMATAGAAMTKDFAEKAEEAFDFIGKIDLMETGKNIIKNTSNLGQAVYESFIVYFDALPDYFKFALGLIIPAAKTIFQTLLNAVKNISMVLWEPIRIGLSIVAGKIKKVFFDMLDAIKAKINIAIDAINLMPGVKIVPLKMTNFIDTTDLSLANTAIGEFFTSVSENNIQTAADAKDAMHKIWTDYANSIIVMNKKIEVSEDNKNLAIIKGEKISGEATEKTTKITLDAGIAAGQSAESALGAIRSIIKAKFSEMIAGLLAEEITTKGFLGVLTGAAAAGAAAGLFERSVPKFAQGGSFETAGPQLFMAGDNVGGRERVDITPLSSPGMAGGGGGGSVTVNVSGNLMSSEYVEGELAEQIKEAIRRGNDFGVS